MSGEAPAGPIRLPEDVRSRLVALADETLASLPVSEVPTPLRPFLRFTPGRRVRHAAPALAAALETHEGFRRSVSERLRQALPGVADALESGQPPAAADPADVAAAAYLLRTEGWEAVVDSVAEVGLAAQQSAELALAQESTARALEQLAGARQQAKVDTDRLRGELATVKAEVVDLRRRLHAAREETKVAEARARAAEEQAAVTTAEAAAVVARSEADARRLRDRRAGLDAERDHIRRQVREVRAVEDLRVRLLLDVVVDAAANLRRELSLPASDGRPADTVPARPPADGLTGIGPRAQAVDDPAVLDALLALPRVHLVVDGYNVTKSGYGGLSLQAQRERLVTGLGALVARTGAEVTCCFDGAAVEAPVVVARPRGVRVLFSLPGETADELIRRLVAAEPVGRPVVVVSSDKEVAACARGSGARAVASMALVRRLERA